MNKLTKVLSVFLIAGAIGTGVAGAAGCAHKHTFDETKWETATGSETHWHPATCGHDVKKDEEKHADTNGDGKCDKCEAPVNSAADKLVIKKEVDGLIVEGVTGGDVQLSKEKTSHSIDKSAIKVYTAVGTTKGDEVPVANLDIKLTDPAKAEVTDWSGLKTNGTYKIDIKLKNAEMEAGAAATVADLATTVSINIKNAVVANSLTLKEGTTTQAQSVVDSMTSTWKFEVERANGEKIAVTGTPTYEGLETSVAGENKEVTAKVTVDGVECTGKVTYTITANTELRVQSYAYNFGSDTHDGCYDEDEYIVDSKPSDHSGTYIMIPGSNTAAAGEASNANGVKMELNKPRESTDGEKYFVNRLSFSGGTFTGTSGTIDSSANKKKYIVINAESAGKLTLYWSRNSSNDTRGLALWTKEQWDAGFKIDASSSSKPAPYDFAGATTGDGENAKSIKPVDSVSVGNTTGKETNPELATFTIPAAGTYYLTTATSQAVYLYYIQLDNEYNDGTKENITVQPGEKTLVSISKSHSADVTDNPYVQQFNLGDTFGVNEGYSFKGISCTANTAEMSEDALAVADLKFYLGTTEIIPGTTVLNEALITQTGEQTITVKKGDASTTYKINVASALGVDSITARLINTLETEVASDAATVLVKLSDIVVETVGTNENVDVTYTATYLAKAATGEGTAITAEGVQIGKGEYVITVTATVTDKTNTALTKEFTATVDLVITVAGNEISWLYQTKYASGTKDDPEYAANSTIVNSSIITVENLVELKNGVNTATGASATADFPGSITNSSNKPTLAASGTMSGQAITFTNALAFTERAIKATAAVGTEGEEGYKPAVEEVAPELLKITAKQKTKVYLYLNACDSKHGGNRDGVKFFVKKGDGEYATEAAMTTAARKSVQAFILELEEGDVVTIKAQYPSTGSQANAYIWFYGFEAKVVA